MFGREKIVSFLKNKSRYVLAFFALSLVPFLSGCGSATQSGYTVNLEIWGVFDDSTVFNDIITQYKQVDPYVGDIKYRKFSQDTYPQELLDALASGQGPDIFLIGNAWLPSYENKLSPAPAPLMNQQDMANNFPDVVSSDFMDGGKVYAVPLSVDSMQLYYNKDMFNAAGITSPPTNWTDFRSDVQKLTKVDSVGNFTQAGAAIGTAQNINRAPDLLSLLMYQNGVAMPSAKGMLAQFDQGVVGPGGQVAQAGEQALGFYTQFAKVSTDSNTENPYYTWNSRQDNSVDAFAEGSVAMMFNYSWQIAAIEKENPKLNFAVAPVPEVNPDKPVGFANYWGYAVSLNKVAPVPAVGSQTSAPVPNNVRTQEAWQFLRFLTLKNNGSITLYNAITENSKTFPIKFDPAADYLKKSPQPAARRDLIEAQKSDPMFGVFAEGNLIAKHWYQTDPDNVDSVFSDVIESVVRGDESLHDGLVLAENRINFSTSAAAAK